MIEVAGCQPPSIEPTNSAGGAALACRHCAITDAGRGLTLVSAIQHRAERPPSRPSTAPRHPK